MGLTFKDYVTIADALEVEHLDENWKEAAFAKIKQVLGGKMSDDEIGAEIDKVKAKKAGVMSKIKDTQQSKDFHQRRADLAKAAEERKAKGTQSTVPNTEAAFKSKSTSLMRGGELRALDRNPFAEELVTEAQCEFNVEYVAKAGGSTKKCVIKGIDVTAVKEKFRRQYAGWKFLSAKPKTIRKTKVEEGTSPLGPRMSLEEGKDAKVVVVDGSFDYITRSDREKQGKVKLFWTCKSPEEAEALVSKIKALDAGEIQLDDDDMAHHWGSNSYDDFQGAEGFAVYFDNPKIVSKEPALGRRVYSFNPKDFGL